MAKSIIHRLVEHFGKEVQIDKIQEEAQELALALHQSKYPTKCPIKSQDNIYDETSSLSI